MRDRIFATLNWFSVQQIAPTLLELYRYLLSFSKEGLLALSDELGELKSASSAPAPAIRVSLADLVRELEVLRASGEVGFVCGMYFLPGDETLTEMRRFGFIHLLRRERKIQRFAWLFKFIPFIRGVALAGSQALGLPKPGSDIDLLIFTETGWLWLPRTIVTVFLQMFGVRRYKDKVADRFCLNHYISGAKRVTTGRNLYTASEYAKLRVIWGRFAVDNFQQSNQNWIQNIFPHFKSGYLKNLDGQTLAQKFVEWCLSGRLGMALEKFLMRIEKPRINTQEQYIVVAEDELSFHPQSKQSPLLFKFFQSQK